MSIDKNDDKKTNKISVNWCINIEPKIFYNMILRWWEWGEEGKVNKRSVGDMVFFDEK